MEFARSSHSDPNGCRPFSPRLVERRSSGSPGESMTQGGTVRSRVGKVRVEDSGIATSWDLLAAEEPLEIRLGLGPIARRQTRPVAVTMRTPGHDEELAVGFLLSEQILDDVRDIETTCAESTESPGRRFGDILRVDVRPGVLVDPRRLERNFAATSSCGVCGKASLRALGLDGCARLTRFGPEVDAATIHGLPSVLRGSQALFESTGGVHAAALFTADGSLLAVREDVGRHNTVDKLLGARALGRLDRAVEPGEPVGLLISGRIGFEIVQKAIAGGIALIVAVGAPTSLAVEVAEAFGQTLLGFVGPQRFNVYSAPWRVRLTAPTDLVFPASHVV